MNFLEISRLKYSVFPVSSKNVYSERGSVSPDPPQPACETDDHWLDLTSEHVFSFQDAEKGANSPVRCEQSKQGTKEHLHECTHVNAHFNRPYMISNLTSSSTAISKELGEVSSVLTNEESPASMHGVSM